MVLFIVLAIIVFFGVASLAAFWSYIHPPKIISATMPEDFGLEYEDISFRTADNITLRGWFIASPNENAKTIIVLHGWPADKGNILPFATPLHPQYNLLLFDFRALGKSEGRYSTIGAKETQDLKAALSYLESRGIKEAGIWGFSMGGAVAFMVAADDPRIQAIASDSSYARLDWMAAEAFALPGLRHPLAFATRLWGMLFFRIDAAHVSPVEAARQLDIPVLLIHSRQDNVIPFSHALALQEALQSNRQAEFWFRETGLHGQIGEEYLQKLRAFFEKSL